MKSEFLSSDMLPTYCYHDDREGKGDVKDVTDIVVSVLVEL